tara:strand:- start:1788 stop:1940 length:153 start_codon:yes stop_codon:yes gene_type:complete
MSLRAYYKGTATEIEKLIKEHVDKMRKTYSWDGEHEAVTKEIIKIFKRDS